jgi:hypothetical protein
MAARKKTKTVLPTPKKPWIGEVCDTCEFRTWVTWKDWNFTIGTHLPITLRCPHYKEGKVGIVRGTEACHKYKKRLTDD